MDDARSEDDIGVRKRTLLKEQEELARLIAAADDELLQQGKDLDTSVTSPLHDPDRRETAEDHVDEDGC